MHLIDNASRYIKQLLGMNAKKKSTHVVLRVVEYGYNNQAFSLQDLMDNKIITVPQEYIYILPLLEFSDKTENTNAIARYVENAPDPKHRKYTLLPSTVFSYLDHLELKLAQENAKAAKRQSMWAIILSVIAILVGLLDVFKPELFN